MSTAHQATCVALAQGALLIEGPPGSGKSTLALMLIDRGARLIGDDGVLLRAEAGRVMAAPHPNTRGLIEVRNLGLIDLPAVKEAAAALVIRLDPAAPRFIDSAETTRLCGLDLPLVRLWPDSPALPLKAEWAMRRYGLSPG